MSGAAADYARALFRAAGVQGVLARVAGELTQMEGFLREHAHFFGNPVIPSARQAKVLLHVLEGQADPLTAGFLERLIRDRRLNLLSRICRIYSTMVEAELGDVTVRLRVRYSPSQQILSELREELAKRGLFPKEKRDAAVFDIVIDESVIGGFIAECRGRVIDASLRTRLARLSAAEGSF